MYVATEVEIAVQVVGKLGRVFPELGNNLCGGGPDSPAIWVGGLGYDTAYWEDVGWIISKGGPQADGAATPEGGGGGW